MALVCTSVKSRTIVGKRQISGQGGGIAPDFHMSESPGRIARAGTAAGSRGGPEPEPPACVRLYQLSQFPLCDRSRSCGNGGPLVDRPLVRDHGSNGRAIRFPCRKRQSSAPNRGGPHSRHEP